MMKRRVGFTLIELMIVVAIIGILAAVAVPKFAILTRRSSEGTTKGNLGALRSAVSIYYGDNEGQYPTDDLASLIANYKYLASIPVSKTPAYHPDSTVVVTQTSPNDIGGWSYDNVMGDTNFGSVWVNCTHTDTKGVVWTSY